MQYIKTLGKSRIFAFYNDNCLALFCKICIKHMFRIRKTAHVFRIRRTAHTFRIRKTAHTFRIRRTSHMFRIRKTVDLCG